MRPGRLLAIVDRLPTIDEMPEAPRDSDGRADDFLTHTMDQYMDSIKVLSQPAPFPRHGPLGGHRRWRTRLSNGGGRRGHALFPLATYHPVTYDPAVAPTVALGDVFLVVGGGGGSACETWLGVNNDPLACLFAQPLATELA